MKKSLFAAILLSPGLFFAQSHTGNNKVSIKETSIGYAFPECMRAGPICELFPNDASQTSSNVTAYKGEGNVLVIEINSAVLNQEKQIALLGKLLSEVRENEKHLSRIEKDIPIAPQLLRDLNIDGNLNTIKAGSYLVEIIGHLILLKVELISK